MKSQRTRKKTIIIYHVIKPKVEILIQINYKELRKGNKQEWLRLGQKIGSMKSASSNNHDHNG